MKGFYTVFAANPTLMDKHFNHIIFVSRDLQLKRFAWRHKGIPLASSPNAFAQNERDSRIVVTVPYNRHP